MFRESENRDHGHRVLESPVTIDVPTLQDLVDRLGGIPLSRILLQPAPGLATEEDLLRENARKRRLCELVEGVLVEKAMGLQESLLAGVILIVSSEDLSCHATLAWSLDLMAQSACYRASCVFPTWRSSRGTEFLEARAEGADSQSRPDSGRRGSEQVEHHSRDESEAA